MKLNIFNKPRKLIVLETIIFIVIVTIIVLGLNGIEISALRTFQDTYLSSKLVSYSLIIFVVVIWILGYMIGRTNEYKYSYIFEFISEITIMLFMLHIMYGGNI